MKTSSKIFWGFWGAAALLIIGFIGAASSVTRAWMSPDGKQLKDASSLTGPWKDQPRDLKDFSSLRLNGAFDVSWEQADTWAVTISVPERFSDAFSVTQEGGRLIFSNRLTGRFSELALRVRIQSPTLSEVTAKESMKLKLTGNPGEGLLVSGNGAIWIEGESPTPVERLRVASRGMTVLQLASLPLKNLSLEIHGQVVITAKVSDSLEGEIRGSGELRLLGSPARQHLTNSGSVRMRIE